jgi:biopolymer transport protein ExbD
MINPSIFIVFVIVVLTSLVATSLVSITLHQASAISKENENSHISLIINKDNNNIGNQNQGNSGSNELG